MNDSVNACALFQNFPEFDRSGDNGGVGPVTIRSALRLVFGGREWANLGLPALFLDFLALITMLSRSKLAKCSLRLLWRAAPVASRARL